jgi:hypothetical protein
MSLSQTQTTQAGGTVQQVGAGPVNQLAFSGTVNGIPSLFAGAVVPVDGAGNPVHGTATGQVAAGAGTAAVAVKNSPGRLCKVVVVATGTAAVSIYDNASAASGSVLLTIPANAATGTVYDVGEIAANGITVGQVSNSPALALTYS